MLLLVPLAVLGGSGSARGSTAGEGPVYVMRITGTIDLGLAPYVDRVVAEAEDDGAVAIIIEIDTPGGRLDAVIQMRDTIIDTDVRTVALVDASAFSAGALVAIASDEIYMTPGAVLGAATPVLGGTGEVADEKTISAVRATFESTAEENGRDPQVAAAMVDTRVEIDGLVTDEELLTLTVSEALEFGYAEGVVADLRRTARRARPRRQRARGHEPQPRRAGRPLPHQPAGRRAPPPRRVPPHHRRLLQRAVSASPRSAGSCCWRSSSGVTCSPASPAGRTSCWWWSGSRCSRSRCSCCPGSAWRGSSG